MPINANTLTSSSMAMPLSGGGMGVAGVSTGGSYNPQTGKVPARVGIGLIAVAVGEGGSVEIAVGAGAGATQPVKMVIIAKNATQGIVLRIDMRDGLRGWVVSGCVGRDS